MSRAAVVEEKVELPSYQEKLSFLQVFLKDLLDHEPSTAYMLVKIPAGVRANPIMTWLKTFPRITPQLRTIRAAEGDYQAIDFFTLDVMRLEAFLGLSSAIGLARIPLQTAAVNALEFNGDEPDGSVIVAAEKVAEAATSTPSMSAAATAADPFVGLPKRVRAAYLKVQASISQRRSIYTSEDHLRDAAEQDWEKLTGEFPAAEAVIIFVEAFLQALVNNSSEIIFSVATDKERAERCSPSQLFPLLIWINTFEDFDGCSIQRSNIHILLSKKNIEALKKALIIRDNADISSAAARTTLAKEIAARESAKVRFKLAFIGRMKSYDRSQQSWTFEYTANPLDLNRVLFWLKTVCAGQQVSGESTVRKRDALSFGTLKLTLPQAIVTKLIELFKPSASELVEIYNAVLEGCVPRITKTDQCATIKAFLKQLETHSQDAMQMPLSHYSAPHRILAWLRELLPSIEIKYELSHPKKFIIHLAANGVKLLNTVLTDNAELAAVKAVAVRDIESDRQAAVRQAEQDQVFLQAVRQGGSLALLSPRVTPVQQAAAADTPVPRPFRP